MRDHGLLSALEVLHRDLGNVFQIQMPGFRPVVLVGPKAAHFVLVEARDAFQWRPEDDPITRLLRRGLLVQDGEPHDILRRKMNPALHRQQLPGYIEAMWRRTDQISMTWQDDGPQDMLMEMRKVALLILVDTLFAADFTSHLDRLMPAILRTLRYISPGAWLFWRDIPRPGYRWARNAIDRYLFALIGKRRARNRAGDDMLSLLVDDPTLDDDLIRDQLITMLIAGHDTSTALLAWTLYLLGRHPEALQRARAEVHAVLGDAPPSIDQLPALEYLGRVIEEALRLYPPIHLGTRTATEDVWFDGFRLAAGTRVLYSIYLTHRMAEHWPEPDKFNPARFTTEANRERLHYTFLPFGGGPRNCIGMAFAQVEAKTVLARLLQTHDLALGPAEIHPYMGATLEPHPGVPMQARRRSR